MNALSNLVTVAQQNNKRIVLAEGEDKRVLGGAVRAKREGIATPVLVGRADKVRDVLVNVGADPHQFDIVDPATAPEFESYASVYCKLRQSKGVNIDMARTAMRKPLNFAAMMVRQGDADGSIGGAVATTAETIRAALQIIGRGEGVQTVSSFFLMLLSEHLHPSNHTLVFSDCGMVVDPNDQELAQIALSSAASFQRLLNQTPRVAMLSFSSAGSAKHERVTKVISATKIAQREKPDLLIDGELQFDAAFVPAVAASKTPGSTLQGAANVMIFPNLDAANIAYKIAQRIGGAVAIGPIIQGLARPANDLSRGCSADDVFNLIAVTAVQASCD